MKESSKGDHLELPILPINNRVLFPGGLIRLSIGQPSSVHLVQNAIWEFNRTKKKSFFVGIFTRISENNTMEVVEMTKEVKVLPSELLPEVYEIGTLARVVQLTSASQKQSFQFSMLVEGVARIQCKQILQKEPYILSNVEIVKEKDSIDDPEVRELALRLQKCGRDFLNAAKTSHVLTKVKEAVEDLVKYSPGDVADVFVANLDISVVEKQGVLNAIHLKERLKLALELVEGQLQISQISNKIDDQIQDKISEAKKEYYLRQQLKAIKHELGEDGNEEDEDDYSLLCKKLETIPLSEEAKKVATRELKRLKGMQVSQPEYSVIRSYLDCLLSLPWSTETNDLLDYHKVRNQLDLDHYGLNQVKKRICEYIAVRQLKADMKGPILCLVGPPGVGKTSLGKSIATAMDRKFQRISLGGVGDEATIRGHRRTYIGAMCGNIISSIKKASSRNPILLLDEIDKLGNDNRGDPASALLEVLDPNQNHAFMDNYLDVPFDLSNVLFIATANTTDTIPPPLLDRMEIIDLPGYITEEKIAIAEQYLLPRQLEENGLTGKEFNLSNEMIQQLISKYTREPGVRNLERRIGAICRYVAVELVNWRDNQNNEQSNNNKIQESFPTLSITLVELSKILGHERFFSETALRNGIPGVATGMAWTSVGGELLFIEANSMEGSGKINLTGKLGEVMKESVHLSLSWIRSNIHKLRQAFHMDLNAYDKNQDLHLHFPAGGIPKDGPSAGIAVVIAVISLLTDKPVPPTIALTGEITLRGIILPVGGIKEKVLAAYRGGIQKVILPLRNLNDTTDLPDIVHEKMEFVYVGTVMEALCSIFSLSLLDDGTSNVLLNGSEVDVACSLLMSHL